MSQKSFDKLVKLMARLRAKNGCPWDRAQTHSSLKKYLIEEAYEVCDVIDSRNSERLKDELGDLLFQAIFHAQIAKERRAFDIDGVLRASLKKMLRRHPHVFGKHKAKGPEEAYRRWEEKKHKENNNKEGKRLLRGVPGNLPALLKAQKVLRRATGLGFDISKELSYLPKGTRLPLGRLTGGQEKNKRKLTEEIGYALLAVVNSARFADIDAEEALNKSIKKFAKRLDHLFKKNHTKTHQK